MPSASGGCVVALVILMSVCLTSHGHEPVEAAPSEPAAAAERAPAPSGAETKTPGEPKSGVGDLLKRVEKLEKAGTRPGPTVNWTGQLQADLVRFGQDAGHRAQFGTAPDGAAFRRARVGMFGDYGSFDYRLEWDFALAGRPSFLDVFAGLHDLPHVGHLRVGHFFEPYSLERVTPNRFVTFLERSLMDEAFNPARNLGVMARRTFADDRAGLAAGVFSSDSDVFGDASGRPDGLAFTTRGTALPVFEGGGERLVHLGLGYSLRQPRDGVTRFRARPELRTGTADPNIPFVADTGDLRASHYQLIGVEVLAIRGPWAAQAEYSLVPVSLRTGGGSVFGGGYAETTYLLTGEHRRYRKENGTVDRLIPARSFIGPGKGEVGDGPGAVELAARVSHLNLTDGVVRGGRTWDVTLGVNWYLNRNVRVTANYVYSRPELSVGEGESHGFGLRLGYEF